MIFVVSQGRELKRSPQHKRDPTLTKTIRTNYEKALVALISSFEQEIIGVLKNNLREYAVTYDAPGISLQFKEIKERADTAADATIEKQTETAIQSGFKKSSLQLSRNGIDIIHTLPRTDMALRDALKVRTVFLWDSLTGDAIKNIITELSLGLEQGEGIKQLTKRIKDKIDVTKAKARAIARTETLHAHNQAAETRYRQAGVQKVQWIRGGSKECKHTPSCEDMDGVIFDIDSNHPRPPIGTNCMCSIIPIVE